MPRSTAIKIINKSWPNPGLQRFSFLIEKLVLHFTFMICFFFLNLFTYILIVLGLHCYAGFSLIAASGGCSLVMVSRLLIAVASLAAEHRF